LVFPEVSNSFLELIADRLGAPQASCLAHYEILRGRLAAGCLLIILSGPLFGGAYIFTGNNAHASPEVGVLFRHVRNPRN